MHRTAKPHIHCNTATGMVRVDAHVRLSVDLLLSCQECTGSDYLGKTALLSRLACCYALGTNIFMLWGH